MVIGLVNAANCRAQPQPAHTAPAEFEAASIKVSLRLSAGGFGWRSMAARQGRPNTFHVPKLLSPDRRGMAVIEGRVRMRLSNQIDLPVTDLTRLKGKYDFSLYWMIPEPERTALPLTADPGLGASASATDSGPSLFSAIQSQLGLMLAPKKGPVSIIVIDHVERFSGN
jgi:hypothetical protein